MDPRIYLAIDNCFAIKRWTEPKEWMRVINDLGLKYIECVTDIDNEPLLMEPNYRQQWVDEVQNLQAKTGNKVIMMYSNNSTYDTTGLAHPNPDVRNHIINTWFDNFMDMATGINADIGYFVHGIPEKILFDKDAYAKAYENATNSIIEINKRASHKGIGKVAIEQMYTPHQPPFTIQAMKDLMLHVYAESNKELYFTEDVGHHCDKYMRPTNEELNNAFRRFKKDGYIEVWLGSKTAIDLFVNSDSTHDGSLSDYTLSKINENMSNNNTMFTLYEDIDCYSWLEEIGCYSPVVHLQQTNGTHSSHKPFTPQYNDTGIIHPVRILEAIKKSYDKPKESGMFAKVNDIYLTFELYASTKDIGYQVLYDMQLSVDYFRQYIPTDGMYLSEILVHCMSKI